MSCILALCACKPKSELSKYITNYNEVTEALEDRFSHPKITNEEPRSEVQEFGKGYWFLYVNDVRVTVLVYNHVAVSLKYYDGSSTQLICLPGGDRLIEQMIYNRDDAVLVLDKGIIQEVTDPGASCRRVGDNLVSYYSEMYCIEQLAK
jgi:hypothetical protein